ncbi:MAG: FAD-dependent oxidoreductase [Bacteroidota bacterium]
MKSKLPKSKSACSISHIIFMVILSISLLFSKQASYCQTNNQTKSQHAQVIVIGAGIAGLTTALILSKKGVDVLLLEKNLQVGGRLNSVTVGGIPCNMGAQWIVTGLQPVIDPYIERLQLQHLKNISVVWNDKLIMPGTGNYLSQLPISKEAQNDMISSIVKMANDHKKLFKGNGRDWVFDLQAEDSLWIKLEKQTIADYLSAYHPDVIKFWDARVGGGFGGNANNISALVLVAWYGGDPNIPMAIVKGGNQLLAEEMLKDCKNAGMKLVLGADVTEVKQKGTQVMIICRDGREYASEYVVVAVPSFAAKEIVKELSAEKSEALESVKYNPLAEVGMHLKNFPSGEELSALMFIGGDVAAILNQTGDIAGNPKVGTVICVTINKKEIMDLPDKELVALIAKELKKVSPNFDPGKDVIEYSVKRWKIGEVHVTPNYLSKYRKLLREPSGRIYFAGDYVSDFPTWGGAVWSGSKAASELLSKPGK